MHGRLLSVATALSDAELLGRVVLLAGRERQATVELIAHLAELDARRLYLAEGYGSLFAYCTGSLRLAEHAAYNRIEAARLSRRFPAVLDLLADGSLNLSTARLIAPHLRPDNFEALVAGARRRGKREVEMLVARLQPRPDVAASVRRLPPRAQPSPEPQPLGAGASIKPGPGAVTTSGPGATATPGPGATGVPANLDPDPEAPPALLALAASESSHASPPALDGAATGRPGPRPTVTPLAPERYRVQFTIGAATHERLRRVQDLLRREIPDGDPGAIFDRALTLLLEDVSRKKLAVTARPHHRQPAPTRSRHIPASVKRAVWRRDGGRCAFVAESGRRCDARAFLEFHHREPHAIGGETAVANISLRCRAHNAYEARRVFGPGLHRSAMPRSAVP